MEYDLKITGGSIIDGSGQPAFAGEVGIRGGKIAALGKVDGAAARTIDAEGRVVAPGFVDIHTHYDAQVMWDRMMTISPWHGVTTVVMGNCGFGVAPTRSQHRGLIMRTLEKVEGMSLEALESGLSYDWPFETFADYLGAVERRGIAINAGAMVGHTPVRLYVMGEEATERPATADEIAAMRAIVRDAIGAGALGFATSKSNTHVGYGGKPVPSRAADFAEIKALAGALGEAGQRYHAGHRRPRVVLQRVRRDLARDRPSRYMDGAAGRDDGPGEPSPAARAQPRGVLRRRASHSSGRLPATQLRVQLQATLYL